MCHVKGIVHPSIDVYFDLAVLNDSCGSVLNGRHLKPFGNVEKKYGFIFNGFVSMQMLLTFDISIFVKTIKI